MDYGSVEEVKKHLDKKFPHHVVKGDKVEMHAERFQLSGVKWELNDIGTVIYVGPGYATVRFLKNRETIGDLDLKLNLDSGRIDQRQRVHGFKFVGPIREGLITNVDED